MNFTREPIIETIISPKDGFKLVVRNSKVAGLEEYSVDAIEVISFGSAMFYRSLEKPKSFLLPVTDFEVVEMRETKVNLKSVNIDKTIKIGVHKEAVAKSSEQKAPDQEGKEVAGATADSKRKKRSKKKRGQDRKEEHKEGVHSHRETSVEGEKQVSAMPYVKTLIPPPSTLISETIGRYKSLQGEDAEMLMTPKESQKETEALEGEEGSFVLNHPPFDEGDFDAIWMQETPHFEEGAYLDDAEDAKEPLKFAKADESDEPIGKTHIEEALKDEDEI